MQIITIEIFRTMEPACFGIQTYLSTKEEAKPVRISVFLYLYSCIATLKNSTFEILQQAGAPKYRRRATLWAVTLSDFPPSQCQLTLVLGSPQIQYNVNRNTYTHTNTQIQRQYIAKIRLPAKKTQFEKKQTLKTGTFHKLLQRSTH